MLNGVAADITVDGSTVMIENAVITMTDMEASNGTIHVIDAVLTPPAEQPTYLHNRATRGTAFGPVSVQRGGTGLPSSGSYREFGPPGRRRNLGPSNCVLRFVEMQ